MGGEGYDVLMVLTANFTDDIFGLVNGYIHSPLRQQPVPAEYRPQILVTGGRGDFPQGAQQIQRFLAARGSIFSGNRLNPLIHSHFPPNL